MSEFDWWPQPKLEVLVRALRGCDNDPPPTSDEAFWEKVAEDCYEADGRRGEPLDAEELASDVHQEFDSTRLTPSGITGVSVGDLCCAESRLVGLVKGIQGVVYVASHPMESLWADDGILYHTIVVSIQEPSHTLSSQLRAACTFLAAHRPALVCSSCTALSACVLAAFGYQQAKGATPILEHLTAVQAELGITAQDISAADIAELRAFATLVPPPTNSYLSPLARLAPPPPPKVKPLHMGGGGEKDDVDGGALEEEDSSDALSTPRMKGTSAFPLIGTTSTDSTSTQVESDLIETPRSNKRPAERTDAADDKASGIITRGGRWKRAKVIEEGGVKPLAEERATEQHRGSRASAPGGGGSRKVDPLRYARDHLADVDAEEESDEAKVAAMALQKYVRGDCSRCSQVGVLGWAAGSEGFECCACHDTHDADDADDGQTDDGFSFSNDGGLIAL